MATASEISCPTCAVPEKSSPPSHWQWLVLFIPLALLWVTPVLKLCQKGGHLMMRAFAYKTRQAPTRRQAADGWLAAVFNHKLLATVDFKFAETNWFKSCEGNLWIPLGHGQLLIKNNMAFLSKGKPLLSETQRGPYLPTTRPQGPRYCKRTFHPEAPSSQRRPGLEIQEAMPKVGIPTSSTQRIICSAWPLVTPH